MTTLKHVYAIKLFVQGGNLTDDFPFPNSSIIHFMEIARNTLLEQKANKYHHISEQNYQTWCADLEPADFNNCCKDLSLPCKIFRTKNKIPTTISTRWGDLTKVMLYDGTVISRTTPTTNSLDKYSRTGAENELGWFIHDGYIYIVHSCDLKSILVSSLFSSPEELVKEDCKTKTTECNYLDSIFPIDPDLVDIMYRMVAQKLINTNAASDQNNSTYEVPSRGIGQNESQTS